MTFGRLVWYLTPSDRRTFSTLWVPARWITPIFVSFDMFAFLIQLASITDVRSAYTSSKPLKDATTMFEHGLHVLKVGLIIQLLCFTAFAIIGLRFTLVSRKWVNHSTALEGKSKRCVWMVNGAGTLIMVGAISSRNDRLILTRNSCQQYTESLNSLSPSPTLRPRNQHPAHRPIWDTIF